MGDICQDFPSCTEEISIAELKAEHYQDGFGIFHPAPRLSWRFSATTAPNWKQSAYEIAITRGGKTQSFRVESSKSSLVPWPSSTLASREVAHVSVRATGTNGVQSGWAKLTVEAALLKRSDWQADLISGPPQDVDKPKPPFRMRKSFEYDGGPARLYATAHGIYQVEINGQICGDQVLSPGWQSYRHRLHYQTYDVTRFLIPGRNTIGVYLGEGWFAGRLGRPGVSNIWGSRLGFPGQLEVNGHIIYRTDHAWEVLVDGPILSSEIYNGEVYDKAVLIAPEAPPVRRILQLQPQRIITTPSGKKVLDFGQNLAGWLSVNIDIPVTGTVTIRHAEAMEHGELGTRPLRTAKASTVIHLGGETPRCRYADVTGYDACSLSDFTAIVVSSDLRRTGTFECSHDHLNKLHENTIWSMRGNFISVPTGCPQRDERLGWTGDIQVFTPTASFLYDTAAFIGGWLQDVEADQKDLGGIVPNVVPCIPMPPKHNENKAMAAWGDTVILTPWDLY
ncbi:hypothetical protein CEP54_012195 [Fusarium duplospermum]|uniref:alpha-L-rhamnosidase n=1 Tax=Fusarium duplospermum TaxID=1325734 RepID=A0A428PAA1_9HYPO|nr:hypothetical protein CEP54_012195 [Fusarium duplospermum]